jgi:hypothetical protein
VIPWYKRTCPAKCSVQESDEGGKEPLKASFSLLSPSESFAGVTSAMCFCIFGVADLGPPLLSFTLSAIVLAL